MDISQSVVLAWVPYLGTDSCQFEGNLPNTSVNISKTGFEQGGCYTKTYEPFGPKLKFLRYLDHRYTLC